MFKVANLNLVMLNVGAFSLPQYKTSRRLGLLACSSLSAVGQQELIHISKIIQNLKANKNNISNSISRQKDLASVDESDNSCESKMPLIIPIININEPPTALEMLGSFFDTLHSNIICEWAILNENLFSNLLKLKKNMNSLKINKVQEKIFGLLISEMRYIKLICALQCVNQLLIEDSRKIQVSFLSLFLSLTYI